MAWAFGPQHRRPRRRCFALCGTPTRGRRCGRGRPRHQLKLRQLPTPSRWHKGSASSPNRECALQRNSHSFAGSAEVALPRRKQRRRVMGQFARGGGRDSIGSGDGDCAPPRRVGPGSLPRASHRTGRKPPARTRPPCPFVFLRSKICYPLLSSAPRGYALRFRYGCRHRLRLAPFIQLVAAHAGHSRGGRPARWDDLRSACCEVEQGTLTRGQRCGRDARATGSPAAGDSPTARIS